MQHLHNVSEITGIAIEHHAFIRTPEYCPIGDMLPPTVTEHEVGNNTLNKTFENTFRYDA